VFALAHSRRWPNTSPHHDHPPVDHFDLLNDDHVDALNNDYKYDINEFNYRAGTLNVTTVNIHAWSPRIWRRRFGRRNANAGCDTNGELGSNSSSRRTS
jgi:hypothetical protein